MRAYLDHNATSPLSPEARESLHRHIDAPPANPGSVHAEGQRARGLLERARRTMLSRLGNPGGRVVFSGGATESNNMVLQAAISRGERILSSKLEHPSVIEPLRGAEVTWLRHDADAQWDLDALDAALDECQLVSLIWGNNELGTLNPIGEVAARCLAKGVALHVDAAQVFTRLPITIPEGVSTMTLCAHKAGGPVGVGALWVAEGVRAPKLVVGGHQERGTRAGTEDVARIDAWLATPVDERWTELQASRDAFESVLRESLGAVVNGGGPRLPNTTNLSVPGLDAETALMTLDLAGIAASAGSACTAGSIDPSPVLLALGVDDWRVAGALRFSLGPGQRDGQALGERVAAALQGVIRA